MHRCSANLRLILAAKLELASYHNFRSGNSFLRFNHSIKYTAPGRFPCQKLHCVNFVLASNRTTVLFGLQGMPLIENSYRGMRI